MLATPDRAGLFGGVGVVNGISDLEEVSSDTLRATGFGNALLCTTHLSMPAGSTLLSSRRVSSLASASDASVSPTSSTSSRSSLRGAAPLRELAGSSTGNSVSMMHVASFATTVSLRRGQSTSAVHSGGGAAPSGNRERARSDHRRDRCRRCVPWRSGGAEGAVRGTPANDLRRSIFTAA